jgi:hypothetical protein
MTRNFAVEPEGICITHGDLESIGRSSWEPVEIILKNLSIVI